MEPPEKQKSKNPPRTPKNHPYHHTLQIRIDPCPYGHKRIPERPHQPPPHFPSFFRCFSVRLSVFSRSNRHLPNPPRRLQTHPFHHTLTIRTHPDPFERILTQDRAHQAPLIFQGFSIVFRSVSDIFLISPDQVLGGPGWSPDKKFPWRAGCSYFT